MEDSFDVIFVVVVVVMNNAHNSKLFEIEIKPKILLKFINQTVYVKREAEIKAMCTVHILALL